ncbi:hypothetical protein [Nonomuraea basaltis]|uniref:hypothetical protein n=1 Tax=Nonomuraea basaltis TaxID=2495887 RepID=UPI001485ED1E|nr:hypothetical protein [Nonomuraea basaltis]
MARALDRRVLDVGDAWPGNRNDIVLYRNTVAKYPAVAGHRRLSGDGWRLSRPA